ncbi:lipopolysaccharide biosynthesis protein [Geodermatophilus sp. SYSU D00758]
MPSPADPATAPVAAVPAAHPPAGTAAGGLGRIAARGAGVTLAAQAARIVLQLASVVVLARLLGPRDYGLFAVGLVVVGLGEVVRDLGLTTAAIRAPHLTPAQRDGLFWVSAAAGAALAVLAVAGSGAIATAFGEPAVEVIVQVLALTFLLNGLSAQYRAGLSRDLRFGTVAAGDLVAQLLAFGAAVGAAAAGSGYWALVAQQLVQGAVVLAWAVAAARWLPGRPRRGVGLGPFLRFGGGVAGTQVVHHLGQNLDNLVLGLRAGPADLGVYSRGFQLLMTPLNQLRSPATTVAVPVLARLQDDVGRAGDYLRRGQLALGYPLVGALAVAAGAAVPLVDLLLGDRWHAVAPVLALLAVAGSAQTLALVGSWVYLSRGLSGALLRYTLLALVLKAAGILGGSGYGLVGVAAGYAAAALLEWPLSLWWLSRVTVLPVRALLGGALRICACGTAAGTACFLATEVCASWPSVGRLAAGAVAGLATYGLAALVPTVRADLAGVVVWGRQVVGR